MADLNVIDMTDDGEGSTEVVLGGVLVKLTTRFNYSAQSWTMDIIDAQGLGIVTGIMMVPGVDMLSPYPEQKELLGGFVLVEEYVGAHLSDSSLGRSTKLIWFPPGASIVI